MAHGKARSRSQIYPMFQCPCGHFVLFYQAQNKESLQGDGLVSMPLRAFCSFLLSWLAASGQPSWVSMPLRAFCSFLPETGFVTYTVGASFNALAGILFFSTAPFPDEMVRNAAHADGFTQRRCFTFDFASFHPRAGPRARIRASRTVSKRGGCPVFAGTAPPRLTIGPRTLTPG